MGYSSDDASQRAAKVVDEKYAAVNIPLSYPDSLNDYIRRKSAAQQEALTAAMYEQAYLARMRPRSAASPAPPPKPEPPSFDATEVPKRRIRLDE